MGPGRRAVTRIAHAYGNSQEALDRALQADIDVIEADMWFRRGDLHIHHEHHIGWLPFLVDKRMATHRPGRFAVPVGKYFVRPAVGTMNLDQLLDSVKGRKRVLLDVKGHYKPGALEAYVRVLLKKIRDHNAEEWAVICGQTYSVLHRIREAAPGLELRYSVEQPYQWERFMSLMERGVRQICMSYRALDESRTSLLTERGIDVFFWTVDDAATANRLVELGANGITSNDLALLTDLPRATS